MACAAPDCWQVFVCGLRSIADAFKHIVIVLGLSLKLGTTAAV